MTSTIYNFGLSWQNVRGIGCDEATAYALDANGSGKVFGTNYCFFAKATGAPEILAPSTALTWNLNGVALNVYRVQGHGFRHQHAQHGHLHGHRWHNTILVS